MQYSNIKAKCTNPSCGKENSVYVEGLVRADGIYSYKCPLCDADSTFTEKAGIMDDHLPENAIIAKLI